MSVLFVGLKGKIYLALFRYHSSVLRYKRNRQSDVIFRLVDHDDTYVFYFIFIFFYIFQTTVLTWHDHIDHAATKNSCEDARQLKDD